MNTNNENNIPTDKTAIPNAETNPVNPSPASQSTQTNEATKKALHERITETSKAAQTASAQKVKLPKGNKIEEYYKMSEQTDIKKKRGRPKKYQTVDEYIRSQQPNAQPTPEPAIEEKVKSCKEAGTPDVISPAINMVACPMIADHFKVDADKIVYTDEELDYLSSLQPSNTFGEASWVSYGICAVSLILIKVFREKKLKIKDESAKKMETAMGKRVHAEPVDLADINLNHE